MLFSRYGPLALAALAALCDGSPVTPVVDLAVVRPRNELAVRGRMDMIEHHLEKRLSCEFSMNHSWKNHVLFAGSWIEAQPSDGTAESVSLAVKCLDCYTKGTVTAKLTTEDIIKPVVRLDFRGVEAYVDMEVAMSAGATYAVNLFATNSPIGMGFPGLSIGLVFYVDLVFSLSAMLDMTGGFYVKVADDAFLEVDVFGGHVIDHFFDGISSKSLPVTVKTGSAMFKADLRLRVQCGAEAEIPLAGIGAGAELGIYANIIEFGAMIESTPTCALQTREWWDLNVGAFVHFDVVVDYKTIGAIPTVSTTLLAAETFTQCWIPRSPAETGGSIAYTTTVTTAGVGGGPPVYSLTASPPAVSVSFGLPGGGGDGGDGSPLTTSTFVLPEITPTTTVTIGGSVPPTTSSPAETKPPVLGFPGGGNSSAPAPSSGFTTTVVPDDGGLVTSTVYVTSTFTITSCAASVINCPASYQKEIVVTATVDVYTTVCPATAVITGPASSSSSPAAAASSAAPAAPDVAVVHVITDVIVLVPCAKPVVETFSPPASVAIPSVHYITGGFMPTDAVAAVPPPAPTGKIAAVDPDKGGKDDYGYVWSNGTTTTAKPPVAKPSSGLTTTPLPVKPQFAGAPQTGPRGAASFVAVVGVVVGALVLI